MISNYFSVCSSAPAPHYYGNAFQLNIANSLIHMTSYCKSADPIWHLIFSVWNIWVGKFFTWPESWLEVRPGLLLVRVWVLIMNYTCHARLPIFQLACKYGGLKTIFQMFWCSAANRSIGEVVQSQRRPLLGPSPGWVADAKVIMCGRVG